MKLPRCHLFRAQLLRLEGGWPFFGWRLSLCRKETSFFGVPQRAILLWLIWVVKVEVWLTVSACSTWSGAGVFEGKLKSTNYSCGLSESKRVLVLWNVSLFPCERAVIHRYTTATEDRFTFNVEPSGFFIGHSRVGRIVLRIDFPYFPLKV